MAISGKILGAGIVAVAAVLGAGVYYAQVYGYYEDVRVDDAMVQLTSVVTNQPEQIVISDFQAIDANSSPIRYRACFQTPLSIAMLTETYALFDSPTPLNAPDWFSCFDAAQIGADIESGQVFVFTGQKNFEYGTDRVVAIYPDGRGFVWHQINACGEKLYDGSPATTDCPQKEN